MIQLLYTLQIDLGDKSSNHTHYSVIRYIDTGKLCIPMTYLFYNWKFTASLLNWEGRVPLPLLFPRSHHFFVVSKKSVHTHRHTPTHNFPFYWNSIHSWTHKWTDSSSVWPLFDCLSTFWRRNFPQNSSVKYTTYSKCHVGHPYFFIFFYMAITIQPT